MGGRAKPNSQRATVCVAGSDGIVGPGGGKDAVGRSITSDAPRRDVVADLLCLSLEGGEGERGGRGGEGGGESFRGLGVCCILN